MSSAESLAAAFAALDRLPEIERQLVRATAALTNQATAEAMAAALDDGLHPDHAYTAVMAAKIVGYTPGSLRKVPEALLPRVRAGRFRGIDLMAFRGDVTHQEAKAYKEASSARVRAMSRRAV